MNTDREYLFRWRDALLSKHGPPATTRFVLLVLSTHGNTDGREIFPSTRTLAVETKLSRETVEGHVRQAQEDGWISRFNVGERGGKGWRRMRYVLEIPEKVAKELGHDEEKVAKELGQQDNVGGQDDRDGGQAHRLGGQDDTPLVAKELGHTSSVTSPETSSKTSEKNLSFHEHDEDDGKGLTTLDTLAEAAVERGMGLVAFQRENPTFPPDQKRDAFRRALARANGGMFRG